jgi:hypothetical protein
MIAIRFIHHALRTRAAGLTLLVAGLAALVLWSAVSPEDDQPAARPTAVESGDALRVPINSLGEATGRADLVAVVVPTGASSQEWFSGETLTATLHELRIEQVLKGDGLVQRGSTIWAYVPGGEVASSFPAQGSRRPNQNAQTILEESSESPHYSKARRELVFLTVNSDGTQWADMGAGSRYDANAQSKLRLLPQQGGFDHPSKLPPSDWRTEVVGRSVDNISTIVRQGP